MPELPEVETVVKTLKPIVLNRTILNVEIIRSCTVQGDEEVFINTLKGKTFIDISRIGKYIIFHLNEDKVIISHLRMEGKFYEYKEEEENSKYARMVFHLDNKMKLCYDDSRCFGVMILSDENSYLKEKEIAKLGPEPFKANAKDIYQKVRHIKGPIKSTLLDQSVMTGLGNIYVDETLFASRIHPNTDTSSISEKDWEVLIDNAKNILNEAIKLGGSTIKSYHPGKDVSGEFQTHLHIYGKEGEICPHCGRRFRFTIIGGRGTTYCPICQKKIGKNIKVAITGKIASGKSYVTSLFEEKGYPTISSDTIVHHLYEQKEVADKLGKILNLSFKGYVDVNMLKNHLQKQPNDIKKISRYIHPLVKKEIEKFLNKNNKGITVVEVPLLFESNIDRLFDYIIAIDVPEEKQLTFLNKRNRENADFLIQIYQNNNEFEKYKNKADDLVLNHKDKQYLAKQIESIINKLKRRLS